ncbi:hypothetical protein ACI76D_01530 [Capnocytophaga cynodegmi]
MIFLLINYKLFIGGYVEVMGYANVLELVTIVRSNKKSWVFNGKQ